MDNLLPGEQELVAGAASDDVAFNWVLINLGIASNPPPHPDWRPSNADVDRAFESLGRLVRRGLIQVGRIEYIDGGRPGRVAPVRHVSESLDVVRRRVDESVKAGQTWDEWAYSCWVVEARTTE